jgi:hypothetical protein
MPDVTYYVALPFGAGDDGPEPRELLNALARMLRYEVLNEWHGLRETLALWRSVVQAIRAAVILGMLLC